MHSHIHRLGRVLGNKYSSAVAMRLMVLHLYDSSMQQYACRESGRLPIKRFCALWSVQAFQHNVVNIPQLQTHTHALTCLQIGEQLRDKLPQYCDSKTNGTAFIWPFGAAKLLHTSCVYTCDALVYLALQQAVCRCRRLLLPPPAQHGSCLDWGDTSDPSLDLLNLGCGEGEEGGKEGPLTAYHLWELWQEVLSQLRVSTGLTEQAALDGYHCGNEMEWLALGTRYLCFVIAGNVINTLLYLLFCYLFTAENPRTISRIRRCKHQLNP